jgi:hypothetical protein
MPAEIGQTCAAAASCPLACRDHNNEMHEPVNYARTPISGFFYLKEFNNEVYCCKNGCRNDRFGSQQRCLRSR